MYANKRRLNTLQGIQRQPNQAWLLLKSNKIVRECGEK